MTFTGVPSCRSGQHRLPARLCVHSLRLAGAMGVAEGRTGSGVTAIWTGCSNKIVISTHRCNRDGTALVCREGDVCTARLRPGNSGLADQSPHATARSASRTPISKLTLSGRLRSDNEPSAHFVRTSITGRARGGDAIDACGDALVHDACRDRRGTHATARPPGSYDSSMTAARRLLLT